MTSTDTSPPAAIRLCRSFEREGKPKGYKTTARFVDEASGRTLYSCDIDGHVARNRTDFHDGAGAPAFSIEPNRIVLPTRWPLTAPDGRRGGALVQRLFGRGFWASLDAGGAERFRVVDPRSRTERTAQFVLGGTVTRYGLVASGSSSATPIGSIGEELREGVADGGVKGFLKSLAARSDPLLRLEPAAAGIDPRLLCSLMLLLYEITVPLDRATD